MPGPIFWITSAAALMLLCTAHLLVGVTIGRKFGSDGIVRARGVLDQGLAQSQCQQYAADGLLEKTEALVATCRAISGKNGSAIRSDVAEILSATTALRGALRNGAEWFRKALRELPDVAGRVALSSTRPRRTSTRIEVNDDAVVRDATEHWTSSAPAVRGPGLTVEPSAASAPSTQDVASSAEDAGAELPPWSSLTAEEIERYRTGEGATREVQRQDRRFPYCLPQFVAEVHGKSFPRPDAFKSVKCRDISRRGISFFAAEPPESDELIVTLGNPPEISFVHARVTNHRPACLDGQVGYTVGCEFRARLGEGIYFWNPKLNRVDATATETSDVDCATLR